MAFAPALIVRPRVLETVPPDEGTSAIFVVSCSPFENGVIDDETALPFDDWEAASWFEEPCIR